MVVLEPVAVAVVFEAVPVAVVESWYERFDELGFEDFCFEVLLVDFLVSFSSSFLELKIHQK